MKLIVMALALALTAPASAAKLLVVRKGSRDFEDVSRSFRDAMGTAHTVVDYVIVNETSYPTFARKVRDEKPDLLVLMDNQAVSLAIKLNAEPDAWAKSLRGIATMALNLKKVLKGNRNICGIAYEAPALSLVTQFRYLTDAKIRNVLVVYRASEFSETVRDAQAQLAREGVSLVAVDADAALQDDELDELLEKSLAETVEGKPISAVWVVSDNALLTQSTFGPIWVERSNRLRLPFLCGIEKFASKPINLCAYAVSPNHADLGNQVAEVAFGILEDGRSPEDIGVEYIVSLQQTANRDKLRRLGLTPRSDRLNGVKVAD